MNQEIRLILARVMTDVDAIIAAMPNVSESDPAHDGLCEIVGHLAFARGLALAELAELD